MEEKERRAAPRIEINVEMEIRKNGDIFNGTTVNVSESGLLIQTNKVLSLGEHVTIRLVSQGQEEIVGTGIVVRDQDLGIGQTCYAVHWELTPGQKAELRKLIRSSMG